MGNEFRGLPAHSAEYFDDSRDHWWHDDFIRMVAAHWALDGVRQVLDVGCGVGHWGRVLAPVLPEEARVTGVDRESMWVNKAAERAARAGLSSRFSFQESSAEALPFAAGSFDLVTCQTLLIHVRDPARVLAEMVRVARPGGLVLVSEPTNAAAVLVDSIALGDRPETTAALMRFLLTCQYGKRALGEGFDLLGESVPALLRAAGLTSIDLRQNDRAGFLLPPYASAAEKANVDDFLDAVDRSRWYWDEGTTRRYFLAGGGTEAEFGQQWAEAMALIRRIADAMRAASYSCAGGNLTYLVWGRKP
jgi:ubiquinone/menaquinone biosynthesis C-methylase UbiE